MTEDHWATGVVVAVDGTRATVVAVDTQPSPSRVRLSDGRVVAGDAIEIVDWGGAE